MSATKHSTKRDYGVAGFQAKLPGITVDGRVLETAGQARRGSTPR